MTWQTNLMNNIIVVAIIIGLIVIVYCKITHKNLKDVISEIREGLADE